MEDRLEMARERVGLGSWELLSEAEREKLMEMRIWERDVFEKYVEEREAEAERRERKKYAKSGRGRGRRDETEDEDYEMIE